MIELRHISKAFKLKKTKHKQRHPQIRDKHFHALSDVSISVQPGQVHGLVGSNGSGKSTLLRIAAGLSRQTSGQVEINGKVIRAGEKSSIGYLPSSGALYPFLSAKDNVRFYGKLAGLRGSELETETDRVMDMMGCTPYSDSMPEELSFGMGQRVRLSRLLITHPSALLLDEPSSGVDVIGTLHFEQTLRDVAKTNVPIILVSHNAGEIERLCHDLTFLHQGCVHFQGDIPGLIEDHESKSLAHAMYHMSKELTQ
ncbi:ABC transporter ATP-binding protein [Marinobacter alkaliphilus]|uniref:ABC transporter ATP-binding protein n=1 Tax=Marinobacter alkaliphilus TaxID=254719 RepID=A0ABZ3E944_9GAMM